MFKKKKKLQRYIFGVNVNDSSELPLVAQDVKEFMDTVGEGTEVEIQVSVNPLLVEQGGVTNVIGYNTEELLHQEYDEEEIYEEGEEPQDKIGFKTK